LLQLFELVHYWPSPNGQVYDHGTLVNFNMRFDVHFAVHFADEQQYIHLLTGANMATVARPGGLVTSQLAECLYVGVRNRVRARDTG